MSPEHSPQILLQRILKSPLFRGETPHGALLEYLCVQTQNGNHDVLYEHDIGVHLFSLEPGYDVNENPIVRVTAEETRDRLKQFFATEGRREAIRLVIPKAEYRAFFYEADPATVDTSEEVSGLAEFWAPHWQSPQPTLLLHGELPGEAMPIAEAYAAAMIAMTFHKEDQRLEMLPAGSVDDESLSRRNLILIGSADSNRWLARFLDGVPASPIAERIAPTQTHGWVTLLTAPVVEDLLDAARFVISRESLDRTLAQYGEGGFPPFFRLSITSSAER
ncbi:MAG: hypothetical protein HY820_28840 [Acidobacteria bacterium]|nr:hypothetical protein [Acidobacteriota bacterium]